MSDKFDRMKAFERAFDEFLEKEFPEPKMSWRRVHEFLITVMIYSSLLSWIVVLCLLTTATASAQSSMITPYGLRGYGGPVGSDLNTDPATVTVVFQGRDSFGSLVEAVVPVEIDAVNLDAAINYATFNPNVLDTVYLRETFAELGVTDIDGDGVFSEIVEVTGLPSLSSPFTCVLSPGSVNIGSFATPEECLMEGIAQIDSYGGYDLGGGYSDISAGTFPGNASGDDCRATVSLTVPVGVAHVEAYSVVTFGGKFDAGVNVTSAGDCGTFSAAIEYGDYSGDPLISLVSPVARHWVLGDALAIVAYVEDSTPVEILDTAADLTAALEDEEGDYFECPDCIYPSAYERAPLYWRDGYSFVPGGALNSGGGDTGGGGGLNCEEGADSLACLDTSEWEADAPSEEDLQELVVDPLEGMLFEDFIEDAAFEGYGETRTCPAPFEIERTGILGDGVIEVPVDLLCDTFENYVNPFLMLMAWCCAGMILLRD